MQRSHVHFRRPLLVLLGEYWLLFLESLMMSLNRSPRARWAAANWTSNLSDRSLKIPGEPTRPEKLQCLGVHNNATRPLSLPFVSATSTLTKLLSISWTEPGILCTPSITGPLPNWWTTSPTVPPPACSPDCSLPQLDAASVLYSCPAVPVVINLCTVIHHLGHWWMISCSWYYRNGGGVVVPVICGCNACSPSSAMFGILRVTEDLWPMNWFDYKQEMHLHIKSCTLLTLLHNTNIPDDKRPAV